MKTYYYIGGYFKGNEISCIDTDGKDNYSDRTDHNSKMTFESVKDAEDYIDRIEELNRLARIVHPGFEYQVEIWNPGSVFLVDTWNANKVVGEFDNLDDIYEFLDRKELTEDWENIADTFEEYYDGFFDVSWVDMYDAVKKHGNRKLNYWT